MILQRRLILVVSLGLLWGCAPSTYQRGCRSLETGNAAEAIQLLEGARAERPDDPRVLRELGIAYYRSRQYEPALVHLSRAQDLTPKDARTAFFRGATLEGLSRYEDAIAAYGQYASAPGGGLKREMQARLRVLRHKQLMEDARRALVQENELPGGSLAALAPRGTVAVPPFDASQMAATSAQLGHGVAALLSTDLSLVKQLRVLERARISVLLGELQMAKTGGPPPATPRPDGAWAPSTEVRGLKERLAFLRSAEGRPYFTGTLDDIEDPAVLTAVRDFQRDHGLTADGRVGPMTQKALDEAVDAQRRETERPEPPPAPVVDRSTAPSIGRILRAGTIVSGAITPLTTGSIRLDAITATPGPGARESGSVETDGKLERLFDLEKTIVFGLLDTMGVEPTPEEREAILRYRPTNSVEAFLAYCEGLEHEARGQFSEARGAFQRAASIDPGFREASEAAEENGDLAAAAASGFALEAVDQVLTPPPGPDPLEDLLQTTMDQAGQSLNPTDPQSTDTRLVGIGEPPPRPQP